MSKCCYDLDLDGALLRQQREWLIATADAARTKHAADMRVLDGLIALTDELADQAHDRWGVDCLLTEQATTNDEQ